MTTNRKVIRKIRVINNSLYFIVIELPKAIMAAERVSVPVIDLAKFEGEKEKLVAAMTGLGCFRVVNHGIPQRLMLDMKASLECIFELPSEVKHRNTDIIIGSGYVEPNRFGSLYESLGIYDASSSTDVHTFCSLLDVSSQDRGILSAYASKLHSLIVDLASKVAESIGIKCYSFQQWPCLLRMNKYNFSKETVGSCGVEIHTDHSFMTILLEDELNDGLEIMDSAGNFVAIDPVPGTFLVNVGDIGKVWSNGRLHNVEHRVLCKNARPRITAALFLLAPRDNRVEPHAELIDSEHPKLYRSFNYMEYREIRISTLALDDGVLRQWAVADEAATALSYYLISSSLHSIHPKCILLRV